MLGLIGKKLGMTQVYVEGELVPVTVIEAGPCNVVNIRTPEKDGYSALQLGFAVKKEKLINKPRREYLKKRGQPLYSVLREFRVDDVSGFELGQAITISSFKPGDCLNVAGRTKGRGFQGVIKRWGKHGGPASHGSCFHRAPGSIGMNTWPSRVIKGMKLPGQYGCERVTTRNLEVVEIDADKNLLLVKGSVPGAKNGVVIIYNNTDGYINRDELKSAKKPEASKGEAKGEEGGAEKDAKPEVKAEAETSREVEAPKKDDN